MLIVIVFLICMNIVPLILNTLYSARSECLSDWLTTGHQPSSGRHHWPREGIPCPHLTTVSCFVFVNALLINLFSSNNSFGCGVVIRDFLGWQVTTQTGNHRNARKTWPLQQKSGQESVNMISVCTNALIFQNFTRSRLTDLSQIILLY